MLWGGADPPLTPAPDEVLAVYRIGLHALATSEPRFIDIPESDRPVLQVPLGNDLIHAPTGAVLYQLRRSACSGARASGSTTSSSRSSPGADALVSARHGC